MLQAVLVVVDEDRVAAGDGPVGGGGDGAGGGDRRVGGGVDVRFAVGRGEQRVEAAVGGVDVQPRAVLDAEVGDPRQRVEGAEGRRAQRGDDGADAAGGQARGERVEVHPALGVLRDRL